MSGSRNVSLSGVADARAGSGEMERAKLQWARNAVNEDSLRDSERLLNHLKSQHDRLRTEIMEVSLQVMALELLTQDLRRRVLKSYKKS